jgi:hypothetical protein
MTELEQFVVNPRCAPERVGGCSSHEPAYELAAHSRIKAGKSESPFCAAIFHAHQYEILVRDYAAEENQQNGTKLNSKNCHARRDICAATGDGRCVVVLYRRGSTHTGRHS